MIGCFDQNGDLWITIESKENMPSWVRAMRFSTHQPSGTVEGIRHEINLARLSACNPSTSARARP
jgi:hypothetical protein